MAERWENTTIGEFGESWADRLAPAIEEWLSDCEPPFHDPRTLARIASEVVLQVAKERGLLQAHDQWVERRMGKEVHRG